ncbi:MAG: amino acid ABC transporter permease [Variibacter sp.]
MISGLDWSILWKPPFGEQVFDALLLTIKIAFYSWVFALLLGVFVGVMRDAPNRLVRALATAYVELFRNIPVLVQLFFVYFVMPRVLPLPVRQTLFDFGWETVAAIMALSLYSSAKIAEHVRAGMNTVGRGIRQAALASGLSWTQMQAYVVLPLLLRLIAPSLTSEFVTIFKGSSLAMTVGAVETTYISQRIGAETFHWIEANTYATCVYLACAWVIAALMSVIEKWTRVGGLTYRESK